MAEAGTQPGSFHDRSLGATLCANSESTDSLVVRKPNFSWRVDETYVRVAGRWTYLYRAVDFEGNTIASSLTNGSFHQGSRRGRPTPGRAGRPPGEIHRRISETELLCLGSATKVLLTNC